MSRRDFTRRGFLAGAGACLVPAALPAAVGDVPANPVPAALPPLKLGLVTYNLAKSWDIETIIKNCTETKFEAVELRTTHAHGVESSLSAEKRSEVRKRFEGSAVKLASLGTAFEFHSADPQEVRKNIDGAKEYAKLAADVGAKAIKVRPNGFQTQKGVSEEDTLRQIGRALAEVGASAAEHGIEVRVEVHGQGTCRLPNLRKLIDHANHANVFVCWNSNQEDLLDGGLEANFQLVKDKIRFVHLRDLYLEEYPFRKLFRLLREARFGGYACAEISESGDPVRVMRYFRGLFLAYQDATQEPPSQRP
jgi:sugar phosphate isomerase/epimerase